MSLRSWLRALLPSVGAGGTASKASADDLVAGLHAFLAGGAASKAADDRVEDAIGRALRNQFLSLWQEPNELMKQGRTKPALVKASEIRELARRDFGESDPVYLFSTNNLALLELAAGKYEDGEKHFLEALELRRKSVGESHLDFVKSLHNLARLYFAKGDFVAAEAQTLRILEIEKRLLGEKHPDYRGTLGNLQIIREAIESNQ